MKILKVTPWYPDKESPASGSFIREQARALASRGHEVVVVHPKVDYTTRGFLSYKISNEVDDGIRVVQLRVRSSFPIYNQLNYFLIIRKVCFEIGDQFKPDIIHASIGFPGAFAGRLLCNHLRKPYVFTEHTRPSNNFRSYFHKSLTLTGLAKATTLMAVSSSLANELNMITNRHIEVVPNMVDVERFAIRNHTNENVVRIGFVGGMNTNVKGLDLLLEALADVEKLFELHVAGDGVLRSNYEKLARDLRIDKNVKFYGFVQPEALPAFFRKLDFVVCASRYETFNVSLIEAMASGLPVVSTRCGGPEDFVVSTNGLLCEKSNVRNLRQAIELMMATFNQYKADDVRAFAMRFAPANVVLKLEDIYRQAIST